MTNFYTAESVTIGHPDKLCDLISDTVLDACLRHDPHARVACEALATQGNIVVAGEITAAVMPDISECVRSALTRAGYDAREYQITDLTHAQSPDIAAALNADNDLGAGDQGVMVGYAADETLELLPMPVVLAHRITDRLTRCRSTGEIGSLGPDGKAQVTVEYEGDVPVSVAAVVVSAQHSPETDLDRLEEAIIDKVLAPAMVGMPLTSDIRLLINPSGRFVVGGPDADTGLTGRKLMVDAYGTAAAHGGGAFSGKDPTKVDRSGAYMARYIAKNLVAAGLCSRCEVTLAYAIGQSDPVSVTVDTFDTCPFCTDDCLAAAVQLVFDLTPAGIIEVLNLARPIYADTAANGHFGRTELPWERTDKTALLRDTVL